MRPPRKTSALPLSIRDAAADSLGYSIPDTKIRAHHSAHMQTPIATLRRILSEKRQGFTTDGGRGVELALEIDRLEVAVGCAKSLAEGVIQPRREPARPLAFRTPS